MVADRIKNLREKKDMTQAALAKQLGITRSSVNAWELGISVPSTQYIVEMAEIFGVSTDYLLGVKKQSPSALRDYLRKMFSSCTASRNTSGRCIEYSSKITAAVIIAMARRFFAAIHASLHRRLYQSLLKYRPTASVLSSKPLRRL